jgi:insulysin
MSYKYFDILQTKSDKRSIKGLKLPNNITVVLISDSHIDISSCCIGVNTGYISDKIDGTAHFLEHLLFLGNEKNKDKNDFYSFLQNTGGIGNAYTKQLSTCYYVNTNNLKLKESLEKLIYFFKNPLFDEDIINSEKNIIDSEHKKNINSDYWIMEELFKKFIINKNYKNFGTGNLESLKNIKKKDIKEFFDNYYCSDNMYVCIVDSIHIDLMIQKYIPILNIIPNKKKIKHDYDLIKLINKNLIIYKSISNYTFLNIYLIFECNEKDNDSSQIVRFLISKIINSKYEKSISYYLIEENLCSDINCSIIDNFDKNIVMNINFSIIKKTKKVILKIIDYFYSFINYLKNINEEDFKKFYENYKVINYLKLKYYKKDNTNNIASNTVENLMYYDKFYCINKKYFFNEFSEELYEKYKNMINTVKLKIITNIDISNNNNNENYETDENYKVKYLLTNLIIKPKKYDFSILNFIIFKNNTFLTGGNDKKLTFNQINKLQSVYYIKSIFNDDFSSFTIIKKNNNLINNKNALILGMYIELIFQKLKYKLEPLKDYDMTIKFECVNNYFIITFSGFNLLIENYIYEFMENIEKKKLFEKENIVKLKKYYNNIIKQYLIKLENEKFIAPYEKTLNKLNKIIFKDINIDKKKEFIKNISFEKFQNYYNKIFCSENEIYISIGNIDPMIIIKNLNKFIINKKINQNISTNKINLNYLFKKNEINKNEKNNCVCSCNVVNEISLIYKNNTIIKEIYENNIIKNKFIYIFISKIINEIMFNKIRTEENFGYIVQCTFYEGYIQNKNIMIICYLIQSTKNIDEIKNKIHEINTFLKELIENTNTIENNFNNMKHNKIEELKNYKFTNLKKQMKFYIENIIYNKYDFNLNETELKTLKKINYNEFKNKFINILNNDLFHITHKSSSP